MKKEERDMKKLKRFAELPIEVQQQYQEHANTKGMSEEDLLQRYILFHTLTNDSSYDEVKILQYYEEEIGPIEDITIQVGKFAPKGNLSKIIKFLNIYSLKPKVLLHEKQKQILFELVRKFPLVVSISIRNIYLDAIPPDLLQDHKFLRGISLMNANLQAIPESLFRKTPYIYDIILSNNKIESVTSTMISHLKYLTTLDLQNNNISNFDESVLPQQLYSNQLRLILYNNPLPEDQIKNLDRKYQHKNTIR